MRPAPLRASAPLAALLLAACAVSDAAPPRSTSGGWSAPEEVPQGFATFSRGWHRVESLVADSGGALHALFTDDGDADRRFDRVLYARRAADGRWSIPERLDDGSGRAAAARLALDAAGRPHAFWFKGLDPGRRRFVTDVQHRGWTGTAWSPVASLYHAPGRAELSDVHAAAASVDGGVHLLHVQADGTHALLLGDGAAWRAGPAPRRDGGYLRWNASPAGGVLDFVYVAAQVMEDYRDANNDVWYRAFRDGAWREPVPVRLGAGWTYDPALATDGRGVRHAVWAEGRIEGRSDRLMYASSPDGVRWSAPRDLTPRGLGGDIASPRLALDGSGRLHLLFVRGTVARGPAHVHHAILAGGAWSEPTRPFADQGGATLDLALATDRAGTVHLLWQTMDGRFLHARFGS